VARLRPDRADSDMGALGYGLYRLVDVTTGEVYAGDGPGGYSLDLDAVEAILSEGRQG
jgi:hypothetical protein